MEAQYAEAKEEFIGELKEKTTTITIKDFTPAGVRAEYNQQGEVQGRINSRHLETVSALFKPDGTVEYEGRGVDTTSDGETFLVTAKGKGGEHAELLTAQKAELDQLRQKVAGLTNLTDALLRHILPGTDILSPTERVERAERLLLADKSSGTGGRQDVL